MPSIRFRLEKPTVSGLAQRVAREYGPDARIIDTEEHVVGGIAGVFGRRVIDVTVELPDRAAPDGAHEFSMRSRVGLAALLDDADAHDFGPATEHGTDPWAMAPASAAPVSTQGGDFASVLDALRIDVEPNDGIGGGTPARPLAPAPRRSAEPPVTPMTFDAVLASSAPIRAVAPPAPRLALEATAPVPMRRTAPRQAPPLRLLPAPPAEPTPQEIAAAREYIWATPSPRSRMGMTTPGAPPPPRNRPGDLLLLVGQGDDPVRVANAVRAKLQKGYLCDGGTIEGNTRRRVDDRRGAIAARAYGVRSDQPVIVAYGIGDGDLTDPRHAGLLDIDSDQAWLVLDASRRPEDVLAWTERLRGRVQVDAVASVRATGREPHEALVGIGLPEAWRELAV